MNFRRRFFCPGFRQGFRRRLGVETLEPRRLLAAQPLINEFLAANNDSYPDGDGNKSDWIELYNVGDAAIDLGGWYLTDSGELLTKWQFPQGTVLAADAFLVVFASSPTDDEGNRLHRYVDAGGNPHTNFSLDADGEYLALVQPDRTVASEFQFPNQRDDIAYGIGDNQSKGYLSPPTPGAPNAFAYEGFVRDTEFSFDRGFYDAPFDVEISSETSGATIYYTLDGTVPSATNPSASVYDAPISISTTATLRAYASADRLLPTNVDTHTYLFLADVLQQPDSRDGYPAQWAGRQTIDADYEMDPEIVNHPEYGPQLLDALTSLPTVSLVMDADDWFDSAVGIYANSEERGDEWEKPLSAEFFGFDDGREFQVDAGIQMQGNASRWPSRPKHNMRLVFADRFGPGRLKFQLFDETDINNHNSIILRGGNGDAWINATVFGKAQYIRDQWHRDVQNAMGHDNSLQRYAHLYINGMYWGLFHLFERVEAQFMSEHFGGEPDDYEIIKDIRNSGGQVEALDGDSTAWLEMINRAKGNMNDPTAYASVIETLDVENFIDYLMVNFYTGNNDWDQSNWRAGRRKNGGKFQFFFWDAERTDLNAGGNGGANTSVTRDVTNKNNVNYPTWLHQRLSVNDDYQVAWADRIQKHLFNGGVLTPETTAALWNARADEIRRPIIAESARWGDTHVTNPRTQATWEDQLSDMNRIWFPDRTDILLNQLKNRDLFPNTPAPEFSDRGGTVADGATIELSTDLVVRSTGTIVLPESHNVHALVPTDGSLDDIWYAQSFSPADSWSEGVSGVGFDKGDDLDGAIQLDLVDDWDANRTSVYSRSEFAIDFDSTGTIDQLVLRMKYDDGFIAYLNGTEVARSSNAPAAASFDSLVVGGRPDDEVLSFLDFDITAFKDLLVDDDIGTNVLALHGFNATKFSNDMLISAELVGRADTEIGFAPIYYTLDGSDPRLSGGTLNDLGNTTFLYDGPIGLSEFTTVRARVLNGTEWSPIDEATFVVNPADSAALTISELHYNPPEPTADELAALPWIDQNDFEFVEVLNISDHSVNLRGVAFDRGIQFTFGDTPLAANERIVVVKNLAAFELRYGTDIPVAGEFQGGLSNGGEQVRLVVANGNVAADAEYSDSRLWPNGADGAGSSLVLLDPEDQEIPLSKYYRWASSPAVGGSPGTAGQDQLGVVISEVLANTDGVTQFDAIELHNTTEAPIDISGWFLSDSSDDLTKFEIPTETVLAADGYVVFTEEDFNPKPLEPAPHHFALSSRGDDVWLTIAKSGVASEIIDNVQFDATHIGQSLFRYQPAMESDTRNNVLTPASRLGLGCGGTNHFLSSAVIETIHYLPAAPSDEALSVEPSLDANDLEYVIIGSRPVKSLSGWQIRGGVDFEFPETAQTGDWVLSFDPDELANASKTAAFRTHYGLHDDFPNLIGGYAGNLSDSGEALRLQAPLQGVPGTFVTMDHVAYDDRGTWPLPVPGKSISRKRTTFFGNDGIHWTHTENVAPTPEHEKGDFNGDGFNSIADLDQLMDAANLGIENYEYVFASTLFIPNQGDIEFAIRNVYETILGDANGDGIVDSSDLNQLGLHWQQTVCHGWTDGDFNGDAIVNAADLNQLGLQWQVAAASQSAIPVAQAATVQEPLARRPRAAIQPLRGFDPRTPSAQSHVASQSRSPRFASPDFVSQRPEFLRQTQNLNRRRSRTTSATAQIPPELVDALFEVLPDELLAPGVASLRELHNETFRRTPEP